MAQSSITDNLELALSDFYTIPEIRRNFPEKEHIEKTPHRIVASMMELFGGCFEDPESVLSTAFTEKFYDEMVYVNDIPFVSVCAHHQLPFVGKCHFAYIPNGKIVGLSKIPRMVNSYARRPQVQELLTPQIADSFMKIIQPKGCGLVMEAHHFCMMIRGVESSPSYAKTTALRGVFKKADTKHEFLNGIRKTTEKIWP